MTNPFTMRSWSPYVVGIGIGVLSWFAFATADHPIGITTSFEHAAALAEEAALPGLARSNPYYAEQQREGKPPKLGWEAPLVLGVFLGSLLSARLSGDRTAEAVPPLWRRRFGAGAPKRLAAAFAGGVLLMLGARLARGCTSGHGISGTLQLAAASWLFVLVIFPVGAAAAFLLFGREGTRDA